MFNEFFYQIEDYLVYCKTKGLSEKTINNYLRNIKAFYTYCMDFQITKKNPTDTLKAIPNKRKPRDFITDTQFKMLLKVFNLSAYVEYRDYVMTNLLMDTSIRITECLLIKVEDVDLNKRAIYLPVENTKGRNVYLIKKRYFSCSGIDSCTAKTMLGTFVKDTKHIYIACQSTKSGW